MEAPAPAAADRESLSALLRCLSQLNDEVFTTYFLPKLVEQGSAGAVALTCSQLRTLCQDSVQHLDLTKHQLQGVNPRLKQKPLQLDNPCHSVERAYQLVDAFPKCTSLNLVYDSLSNISPLLQELPDLKTLSIQLDGTAHSVGMRLLSQLHSEAHTGLSCLCLQLDTSWGDSFWTSLGEMAELTRLELAFSTKVTYPCTQRHLHFLTGLSKLESLTVTAPGSLFVELQAADSEPTLQLPMQRFPGRLTSLTKLLLPSQVMFDISSISGCSNLCDLALRAVCGSPRKSPARWRAGEWSALAQLSCLTRLHLHTDFSGVSEDGAFHGVLKQLSGLRRVGAHIWGASFLPMLQSFTHLTAVYGFWGERAGADAHRWVCPHIREVGDAGDVPFQAFPNLVSVTFGAQSVKQLKQLSRFCTGLQRLALTTAPAAVAAEVAHRVVDDPDRVAVFDSLAQMQHLTYLEFAPSTDADLVAFTSAATALKTPKLRSLHLHGDFPVYALMQLHSVRGLEELVVHVSSTKSFAITTSFTAGSIRMLLVALAAVPRVCLVLPRSRPGLQRDVETAQQWAARLGLPMPAVVKTSLAKG